MTIEWIFPTAEKPTTYFKFGRLPNDEWEFTVEDDVDMASVCLRREQLIKLREALDEEIRRTEYDPAPFSSMMPHSRACGFGMHEHGPDCHSNCPTCGNQYN